MENNSLQVLEEGLRNQERQKVKEALHNMEVDHRTIKEMKSLIQKIPKYRIHDIGIDLFEGEVDNEIITGGIILEYLEYYQTDADYIENKIRTHSQSENWNLRQIVVDLFIQLIINDVEGWQSYFTDCVNSENLYHRRMALQVANEIAKSSKYTKNLKKDLLFKIESLIFDEDPQVLTVSSEVLGEGFLRNCPVITLNWIKDKITTIDDPYAKSTLLHVTTSRHARDHISEVLEIIDLVLRDDHERVKKARSAVLHNLSTDNQKEVNSFLENRLEIRQALDHWAELEADGSLNVF